MLKRIVGLAAGLIVLGAASVGSALPAKDFDGKPTIVPGSKNTAFVWRDADGFHVRFTTKKGDKARFLTGRVCTGGVAKLDDVKGYLLEKNEWVKVGPKGHCLTYQFATFAHIDGFNFKTKAKLLTFDFKYDKKRQVPKGHIRIGKKKLHPKLSPFFFTR